MKYPPKKTNFVLDGAQLGSIIACGLEITSQTIFEHCIFNGFNEEVLFGLIERNKIQNKTISFLKKFSLCLWDQGNVYIFFINIEPIILQQKKEYFSKLEQLEKKVNHPLFPQNKKKNCG